MQMRSTGQVQLELHVITMFIMCTPVYMRYVPHGIPQLDHSCLNLHSVEPAIYTLKGLNFWTVGGPQPCGLKLGVYSLPKGHVAIGLSIVSSAVAAVNVMRLFISSRTLLRFFLPL